MTYDNNWKNNFNNDYLYNPEVGWREKTEGERNGPTTHFTNKLDEHLGPYLTVVGELKWVSDIPGVLMAGVAAWVGASAALSLFDAVIGIVK